MGAADDGQRSDRAAERQRASRHNDRIEEVVAVGTQRIVTAVRTDGGRLQLIVWQVAADGKTIDRRGDSGTQAKGASKIALVEMAPNRYLTTVRTEEGHMKLIAWDVSANGNDVDRGEESELVKNVGESRS